MKKIIFLPFLIVCCILLVGCSNNSEVTNTPSTLINNSSYESAKISTSQPIEEIIYTFSTPILDKDPGRQTNIQITCSVLSGNIVKAGNTFSFCDTVGKATIQRGYKEAKVFDENGEVTMGLGGGNCQVSSTLYNAVLQSPTFEIVERHPHGQRVYYVEERQRCCCCMW